MYKIIGADGQTYGPADADQMRRWAAENRIRGETLVQIEGAQEWKPLSAYSELASGMIQPPAFAPPPASSNPRASNKIPAGICAILLGGLGVHKFILGYPGAGVIMLLVSVLTCGIAWPLTHTIGLIEGIVYLCKNDEEFVRTYVDGYRPWF